MPNKFESGPLKQALKLLSKEVWEGRSVLPASYGRGAEVGGKELWSNERATVSIRSLPIIT